MGGLGSICTAKKIISPNIRNEKIKSAIEKKNTSTKYKNVFHSFSPIPTRKASRCSKNLSLLTRLEYNVAKEYFSQIWDTASISGIYENTDPL